MASPTSRSLQELKKRGFTAQVVERFNSFSKKRIDLFGCIDIVAIKQGTGIVGIQATTTSHIQERIDKALKEPKIKEWLACGGLFWVWGWSKKGAKGKRKLWMVEERRFV